MAEIKKTFRESVPAMRFIGKKYPGFGPWWGEWFENGWFDVVEKAMGGTASITAVWENGGGYVGLERRLAGNITEYWLGMFTPAETEVPEGFEYIDFAEGGLGTCFIKGKESEVHNTDPCAEAVVNAGMSIYMDSEGYTWSFENCTCPRYTTPDENGEVILDYCYYVI